MKKHDNGFVQLELELVDPSLFQEPQPKKKKDNDQKRGVIIIDLYGDKEESV